MNIHLQDGLPFVEVTLDHQGQQGNRIKKYLKINILVF